MPLPPALLAKLKKRGIVTENASRDPEEEVFAESYDDDLPDAGKDPRASHLGDMVSQSAGAPGCPNKTNPYHICSLFCFERWGGGIGSDEVDPEMNRKRVRMLRKYPLPMGWEEVFDPGTGRYYYWHVDTDRVAWLSPSHPKSIVSLPANKLGKVLEERNSQNKDRMNEMLRKRGLSPLRESDEEDDNQESGAGRRSDDDNEEESKKSSKRRRVGNSGRATKGPEHDPSDPLDPMDPASYSDVPRGDWRSGLERGDEAKTGVDHTVAGPLFQMRPYPSPGAILRANAGKKKKSAD